MIGCFRKSDNYLFVAHGCIDNPGHLISIISKEKGIDSSLLEEREIDVDQCNEIMTKQIESMQTYVQKRRFEYPSIGDQLDDLFHSGAFSSEMRAKLQAVKDKYPKV